LPPLLKTNADLTSKLHSAVSENQQLTVQHASDEKLIKELKLSLRLSRKKIDEAEAQLKDANEKLKRAPKQIILATNELKGRSLLIPKDVSLLQLVICLNYFLRTGYLCC